MLLAEEETPPNMNIHITCRHLDAPGDIDEKRLFQFAISFQIKCLQYPCPAWLLFSFFDNFLLDLDRDFLLYYIFSIFHSCSEAVPWQ